MQLRSSFRTSSSFHVTLGPFEGFSLLIQAPIGPLPEDEADPTSGMNSSANCSY